VRLHPTRSLAKVDPAIDDESIQYQIGLQLRRLVHYYKSWKASFRTIPYEGADDAWGPEMGENMLLGQGVPVTVDDDSDDDFDKISKNELSDEIVQEMELLNIPLDTMLVS
jgi:hypothetical protein